MAVNTAQGERTGPLPQIQFSERKSAAAVAEINTASTPDQLIVKEFGNLTFILSPAEKLRLVDELGRQIPGFDSINDLTIVNWDDIRAGEDIDTYSNRRSHNPNKFTHLTSSQLITANEKTLADCPTQLQPFLKAYLIRQPGRRMRIPNSNWRVGDPGQTHQVITGNDFILFYDAENTIFVAYNIVDSQGQPQQPPNWKRFDIKDDYLDNLPESISKQVANLREGTAKGVKYIKPHHGFNFIVYEDRITAVKIGNPVSQEEFSDNSPSVGTPSVGENVCIDPQDPQVIYYCSPGKTTEISKLRMEGDPSTWKTERLPIQKYYPQISSLQLDPSGSFFMFETGNEVVLLEKTSLQEVKTLPFKKAIFDKQGKIRGIDQQGRFVVIESNLEQVASEFRKRAVAQKAAGIKVQDLFEASQQAEVEEVTTGVDTEALLPTRLTFEANFLQRLTRAQNLGEVNKNVEILQTLKNQLASRGFNEAQVAFLTQGMAEAINLRQRVFATHEAGTLLGNLNPQITQGLVSTATIPNLQKQLDRLHDISDLLDPNSRTAIIRLTQRFQHQMGELYQRQTAPIREELSNMAVAVRSRLDEMQSRGELADWREDSLPMIREKLAVLANNCPIEAVEVQDQINKTRREVDRLADAYKEKFDKSYHEVREKAVEVIAERTAIVAGNIDTFVAGLAERKFPTVQAAKEHIVRSSKEGEKFQLEKEVETLQRQNPEGAAELGRALKVKIANLYAEITRASKVKVVESGQQMEPFGPNGEVLFPIWEHKVKTQEAAQKRQFNFVFIPDEKTKGPGITLDKIYGDVGVMFIDSKGKLQKVRLFEGNPSEDMWRYGQFIKAKNGIPHTYMSQREFVELKKELEGLGKSNLPLSVELNQRKAAFVAHLQTRPKDQATSPQWQAEFDGLISSYRQFVTEHSTALMYLSRFEKIKRSPEIEYANGKGFVPDMESHWVIDEDTEKYLATMATHFDTQRTLKEGLLMLKGHAGTGKDVLVKIFCARTKRMYFGFDCSKWTTDEDMTQVILLDASEGATKTIKVPSAVLNAIQSPGAVLYFNEFNAMPEDTQIFLHSLFDEKRAMTLKTESGKVIKADSSVLYVASMNPGYKGTSPIQIATRSRMVEMEIDYPPLLGKNKPGDTNPNPPYSPSEALRVARGVSSLEDLTLDEDEFIKVWDHYINLIDNGAPTLTPIQTYDLEVILALVQFSNQLREEFIKSFEKGSSVATAPLPVDLPVTGREMRRAAYALSIVPEQDKALQTVNPDARSRALLDTYFLCHFDKASVKDKIRTAMLQWKSKKRLP